MADRPIIFSAPMIHALLAGRKTQTRRILRWQPDPVVDWLSGPMKDADGVWGQKVAENGLVAPWVWTPLRLLYAVGDRLYVRENHALVPSSAYRMSEGVQQTVNPADRDEAAIYAAGWDRSKPRWRPSIHMPRWASRLTLIVTDVRVERLQDISEADARAEGIFARSAVGDDPHANVWTWQQEGWRYPHPAEAFKALWSSIHGPEAWAENPWLVAISFTVHASNIDQLPAVAEKAA